MGHDYDRQRFPGVCRAVDECGGEHAVEVGRRRHRAWVCAKRTPIAEQSLFRFAINFFWGKHSLSPTDDDRHNED